MSSKGLNMAMANLREPKYQILLVGMSVIIGLILRDFGVPTRIDLGCGVFFFLLVNIIFFSFVSPRSAHKVQ
jgi:hypothetical protein